MSAFEVGQKVKVVNVSQFQNLEGKPDLKLGDIHEVKDICLDSAGNQHLDIGLRTDKNFVRSKETEEELPKNKSFNVEGRQETLITQWCHPSRFELAN